VQQDSALLGFLHGLRHESKLIEEVNHLLRGFIGRDPTERLPQARPALSATACGWSVLAR